jgi:archaellum component FlaC
MQAELSELKRDMSSLKDKVSGMDRDLGVTKHAVANIQTMQNGLGARLDKLEEKIGDKIDLVGREVDTVSREIHLVSSGLSEKLATSTANLTSEISNVNTRQQRSIAYVTGVVAALGITGGLLMLLAKMLFVGGIG